ncbi:Trifunctional nucleotide phosphoesterase protein YfkN [Phytophthora cinnamomi]|uniref:Trifunctional nucleotide phosphoesterase protein YfkN n=1 Tax=Phytophthora cinnamomi TaxID=4785 RepID=UPI00355A9BE2|nr:Trifunctional nucleotide phosphoesterase protein YfkN [Phytophthora cinnamomi]
MAEDPLIVPFAELCGALRGLQEQVEQLARVHEAVDDFNSAFGAFQGAMALHASCLTYPKTPRPPARKSLPKKDKQVSPGSGIPRPSSAHVSPSGNGVQTTGPRNPKGAEAANGDSQQPKKRAPPVGGMKRHGKVEPPHGGNHRIKRRKTQPPKAKAQPAWTWERHVREKIPRKYQSPAELKKLENIVLYLKNRHCAISITDLVQHSGLPVIRCKEILQTLMKLDIIERKREKSGFVYSFGSSN